MDNLDSWRHMQPLSVSVWAISIYCTSICVCWLYTELLACITIYYSGWSLPFSSNLELLVLKIKGKQH